MSAILMGMADLRVRKRVIFLVVLPALLLATGLGLGLMAEAQLGGQIEQERLRLLAIGIDIRPITPDQDAFSEYAAIAQVIDRRLAAGEDVVGADSLRLMRRLELASRKRAVCFGSRPYSDVDIYIDNWCRYVSRHWAGKGDWSSLERLAAFIAACRRQALAGSLAVMDRNLTRLPEAVTYRPQLKNATAWFRSKLEVWPVKPEILAWLEGVGHKMLAANHGKTFSPTIAGRGSWWTGFVEQQQLFRLSADLSTLRQFRRLAEATVRSPSQGHDFENEVIKRLEGEGSWPAKWAASGQGISTSDGGPIRDWLDRNVSLIVLDLQEAKMKGWPLVPTRSKPFCVDPTTGRPIVVSVTGSRVSVGVPGLWTRLGPL